MLCVCVGYCITEGFYYICCVTLNLQNQEIKSKCFVIMKMNVSALFSLTYKL